jgi:hypothetical protein
MSNTESTKMALADAYKMVIEAEKKLVTDLETLVNEFYSDLESLELDFPIDSSAAQACQLLARVKNAMVSIRSYDLPNVKTQYGITDPVVLAPIVPTTTTTTT